MSGRTSDDIRREIERKRQEMDGTVDALERKLSPGQLLDHALWMMRGSDSGSEKARAVGDAVAGFARNHPIPVALMSAGAAWLAAESRRGGTSDVGPGTYARAEGRVGPYMGDALDEGPLRGDGGFTFDGPEADSMVDRARDKAGELKDRMAGRADAVVDRVQMVGDTARERVHVMGDSARASARAMGERGSELAQRTREQAALRARQARERYSSTLDDNPLSIGAAAFGLGLAAGLAAPASRWENERMGHTADTVKGEARSIAQETARAARTVGAEALSVARREALPEGIVDEVKGRVKRVASEAMTAAKEVAREEGLTTEGVRQRLNRVASDAANAAKEVAREEGLTADALKERAREAGERTKDAAREDLG